MSDPGREGEMIAERALAALGFRILARRWRGPFGEIDLVAEDGETLVFVEVKRRGSARFGSAAEAVGRRKQERLTRAALDYMRASGRGGAAARFDVVAIDGEKVEHLRDAFPAREPLR